MQNNNKQDIAVLGMAVMGMNLALNMADKGYSVAIYNRTTERARQAALENPEQNLIVYEDLEGLVAGLKSPRKLFLMVQAGNAVDALIEQLIPLLEPGDIIMDGGNSYFKDSQRRNERLNAEGIYFLGVGVSGGESGARFGPAIMPGGNAEAYNEVADIFDKIAAKTKNGEAVSAYMGEGGAGHYVKMVHNGIEYADMEIIVELYHYMKAKGLSNLDIAEHFETWNEGELSSYLSEITVKILRERDPENSEEFILNMNASTSLSPEIRAYDADLASPYLLDHILDVSEQKGTGRWTNEEGLALGVDLSVLTAGLNARYISMQKALRVKASQKLEANTIESTIGLDFAALKDAFLAARIIAYTQGFSLYKAAAKAYNWSLNYKTIAANFREGCIIRSALLEPIMEAFAENANLENLLLAPQFKATLNRAIPELRKFVAVSALEGHPIPAFFSSLSYYEQIRTARSSAALIQGQRDFFGAHTFQRVDKEGIYHHNWPLEEV